MIELIVSPDLYEINETFRNLDDKFVDGKMMADGPMRKFEGPRVYRCEETLGTRAMAEDNAQINKLSVLKHVIGNINECQALMKTREQRQAELELMLV